MGDISYRNAINEALREEMARDERVFVLGEDISRYGGTHRVTGGLIDIFGEDRVRDTPISENTMVGTALGAALTGMRPIVEISYIDFTLLAFDQIVNQVAKFKYMTGGQANLPLVIRTQGGMGAGNAAQHSQSLESLFVHIPGLIVVMPSTPYDAKGLLKTAIRTDSPVVFIEHKRLYTTKGFIPEREYLLPFGQADIKREGRDVTVVATSAMVRVVLDVADELSKKDIHVEIIDPRTLVPLDVETIINSVKKTNRLLIVHESCVRGGVGSEIAAEVQKRAFDYLDAPVQRLGLPNVPIPYAESLEKLVLPDKTRIVETIIDIIK